MADENDNVVDFPGAIRRARDVLDHTDKDEVTHLLLTRAETKLVFPEFAPDMIDRLPTGARFAARGYQVQLVD